LILSVIFLSCKIKDDKINDFQVYVNSLVAYQKSETVPDYYLGNETSSRRYDIDINKYFDILPNLKMQKGFKLDFIYKSDHPIIYAKNINESKFVTVKSYVNNFDGNYNEILANINNIYLNYIINDDTDKGYFQYILLYLMGDQFYLHNHGLYKDETIICNEKALEKVIENVKSFCLVDGIPIIEIPDKTISQAKLIDFEPRIKFKSEVVEIRVVTFTKFKGFIEKIYAINRSRPNAIRKISSNVLVEFQSSIKF
jgi:hypothetical protein